MRLSTTNKDGEEVFIISYCCPYLLLAKGYLTLFPSLSIGCLTLFPTIYILANMSTSQCPFFELPIELVQEIATYLDPPSAASYALTSRWFLHCLGTSCLQLTGRDREIFLSSLVSQYPGCNYCLLCSKMHRSIPGYEQSWPANWRYQCAGELDLHFQDLCVGSFQGYDSRRHGAGPSNPNISIAPGYLLHWNHIQHVMRRHRYGFGTSADLARFAFATVTSEQKYFEIEARIVQGEFLIRKTFRTPAMALEGNAIMRASFHGSFWVCPHIMYWQNGSCLQAGSKVVSFEPNRGLQQCSCCETEFFCFHASEGYLEVTAWYNFGSSGEQLDSKFRLHGVSAQDTVEFEPGSIFQAWQS